MSRPTFGRRARRRRRLRRAAITTWLVSLVLGAQGFPTGGPLGGGTPRPAGGTVEAREATTGLLRFRRETFAARPERRAQRRRARPSPPAPTEPAEAPATVEEIVYSAAAEFGIDGGYLLAVARCESDLDPAATSSVGYHGLFQFDEQTWAAYGYASIYDPRAQARTAARLLAAGHDERWPNCA